MDCTDYRRIPPHMMEAMSAYVDESRPVGDFLQAVIRNDLREAVGRADDTNIELLDLMEDGDMGLPLFNHRDVMEYARIMGLRTDFPL